MMRGVKEVRDARRDQDEDAYFRAFGYGRPFVQLALDESGDWRGLEPRGIGQPKCNITACRRGCPRLGPPDLAPTCEPSLTGESSERTAAAPGNPACASVPPPPPPPLRPTP